MDNDWRTETGRGVRAAAGAPTRRGDEADRQGAAAALWEAVAKVEQWFSIVRRASSFDSWSAMRRALVGMAERAERGE